MDTHSHTVTQTHRHTHFHIIILPHTHTSTHSYTQTHTCTHAHIHIRMRVWGKSSAWREPSFFLLCGLGLAELLEFVRQEHQHLVSINWKPRPVTLNAEFVEVHDPAPIKKLAGSHSADGKKSKSPKDQAASGQFNSTLLAIDTVRVIRPLTSPRSTQSVKYGPCV
jgi:hypothetical protein